MFEINVFMLWLKKSLCFQYTIIKPQWWISCHTKITSIKCNQSLFTIITCSQCRMLLSVFWPLSSSIRYWSVYNAMWLTKIAQWDIIFCIETNIPFSYEEVVGIPWGKNAHSHVTLPWKYPQILVNRFMKLS